MGPLVPGNPSVLGNQHGWSPKLFRYLQHAVLFPFVSLPLFPFVNEQDKLSVKLSPIDRQN